MEHHKCKIYKGDELFDNRAECWFEIVTREFGIKAAQGNVHSSKLLLKDTISLIYS
jgi:hypothetical protein